MQGSEKRFKIDDKWWKCFSISDFFLKFQLIHLENGFIWPPNSFVMDKYTSVLFVVQSYLPSAIEVA